MRSTHATRLCRGRRGALAPRPAGPARRPRARAGAAGRLHGPLRPPPRPCLRAVRTAKTAGRGGCSDDARAHASEESAYPGDIIETPRRDCGTGVIAAGLRIVKKREERRGGASRSRVVQRACSRVHRYRAPKKILTRFATGAPSEPAERRARGFCGEPPGRGGGPAAAGARASALMVVRWLTADGAHATGGRGAAGTAAALHPPAGGAVAGLRLTCAAAASATRGCTSALLCARAGEPAGEPAGCTGAGVDGCAMAALPAHPLLGAPTKRPRGAAAGCLHLRGGGGASAPADTLATRRPVQWYMSGRMCPPWAWRSHVSTALADSGGCVIGASQR